MSMTPAAFIVKCAGRGIRLSVESGGHVSAAGEAVTQSVQRYLSQHEVQVRALLEPPQMREAHEPLSAPVGAGAINSVNTINASEPAREANEEDPFAAMRLPLCAAAAVLLDGMQWTQMRAILTENAVWHGVYDVAHRMHLAPEKVRAALEYLHLYRFADGDDTVRPVLERCEVGGEMVNVVSPRKKWICVPAIYYFAVPGQLDLSLLAQEPPVPADVPGEAAAEKPKKAPDGDTGQERLF